MVKVLWFIDLILFRLNSINVEFIMNHIAASYNITKYDFTLIPSNNFTLHERYGTFWFILNIIMYEDI